MELQPKPEKWQQQLARDLINQGVDAIIGHHPHVVQTIEYIDNKPVFYSIGNFIADSYLPDTDHAFNVELTISEKIQNIKIQPFTIDNYFPGLLDQNLQIPLLKKQLSFSEHICAIQQKDGWEIKPTNNIDFSENSDYWMFIENNSIITIKELNTGSHLLTYFSENNQSNSICLYGELSELQVADINNDGITDILLGISKEVNFDPIVKKRINIFSYQNQNLQPLWLGTKFINDIETFDVLNTNT